MIVVLTHAFTGNVDLSDLLSSMDDQIVKAKEQALSRKDILDKVEKWRYATEEEKWLEEYERVNIWKLSGSIKCQFPFLMGNDILFTVYETCIIIIFRTIRNSKTWSAIFLGFLFLSCKNFCL